MHVEFYRHNLDAADIAEVTRVLQSVFLTTGPVTAAFEGKFAALTGLPHVVALNSCTGALHLALLALGIGPGDEVITTAMTFIATATAIMHTGATPVLVDADPVTAQIDPVKVAQALTSRTKAVMPVHLYGAMADMRALRAIADAHGLALVEDCAHCIEGERGGVRPGQLSDAACYSFYATKNLACGEGGALAARDPDIAAQVRTLSLHGMSKNAADRYHGKYKHWDMVASGWKYNLNDIHAALLVNQIDRLDALLARRQALAERYDRGLRGTPGLERPQAVGKTAQHLYTIWVDPDRRDEILHQLQERHVGVAVNYRAIHTLRYFRETFGYVPEDFPVANRIGQRTISLPLYPKLTEDELDYVVAQVREVVAG